MTDAISVALLTEMSCELSNEELGAVIRLITRLKESGRTISLRTIHIAAGMDRKSWAEIEEAVLTYFKVTEAGLSLLEKTVESVEPEQVLHHMKGKQGELGFPTASVPRACVPNYADDSKPPNISIRKAIWHEALKLFQGAGMSENSARSILASMLKNFPEGDVAMAISDAGREDALVEPHTWIFARLRAASKKRNTAHRAPGAKAPSNHKIVTPELTGVSNNKAEKIRARNKSLTLKIED